ncbi:hypothetical protein ATE40_001325 [Serratia surfactantfaciens]|nr:hypothetical protein ATE40_001325 [Serratia surfactantfaciens]
MSILKPVILWTMPSDQVCHLCIILNNAGVAPSGAKNKATALFITDQLLRQISGSQLRRGVHSKDLHFLCFITLGMKLFFILSHHQRDLIDMFING